MPSQCTIPDCDRPALARGLCAMHYQRWKKVSDPFSVKAISTADISRFGSYVDRVADEVSCWSWTGGRFSNGYGSISIRHRTLGTHVVAWILVAGPVPNGMSVLHTCDNRPCTRNDNSGVYLLNGVEHERHGHLWLGTTADNVADRHNKGRDASGDRNGSRTHPEKRRRGDEHWTRLHPERILRGEQSPAHLHQETHARGDRSGARLHPELLLRGEKHPGAKLTEASTLEILTRLASGESQASIAADFGVSQPHVSRIKLGNSWRHVHQIELSESND